MSSGPFDSRLGIYVNHPLLAALYSSTTTSAIKNPHVTNFSCSPSNGVISDLKDGKQREKKNCLDLVRRRLFWLVCFSLCVYFPPFFSLFLFDHFPFWAPLKHRHPSNTTPKCLTRSISLSSFWLVKAKRNYSGSGDVNTLSPSPVSFDVDVERLPNNLLVVVIPLKLLGVGGSLFWGYKSADCDK